MQKGLANSAKQAEAGGKEVASNDVHRVTDSKSMNTGTEGPRDAAGTLQNRTSGELASSSHKSSATSAQKPAVATKQTSPLLVPSQNRFKLDNRTTSFRILPPLPPEIADVSVLPNILPCPSISKRSDNILSYVQVNIIQITTYIKLCLICG